MNINWGKQWKPRMREVRSEWSPEQSPVKNSKASDPLRNDKTIKHMGQAQADEHVQRLLSVAPSMCMFTVWAFSLTGISHQNWLTPPLLHNKLLRFELLSVAIDQPSPDLSLSVSVSMYLSFPHFFPSLPLVRLSGPKTQDMTDSNIYKMSKQQHIIFLLYWMFGSCSPPKLMY